MDILKALANSIDGSTYMKAQEQEQLGTLTFKRELNRDVSKPILQLNPFPITLKAEDYKNALSSSNPSGDLKTLFALRQLVDPVPLFNNCYFASDVSSEICYGNILNGLEINKGDEFTYSVISKAKKMFEGSFENMDGTPGAWQPIYTSPENWAVAADSQYQDTLIDMNNASNDGFFNTLGSSPPLQWHSKNMPNTDLDPNTRINTIKMKYLLVNFHRPWFNSTLFPMGGWYLSGQKIGFCSSGSPTTNDGVLPLLPTAMLLGRDIAVDAQWTTKDQQLINKSQAAKEPLFLGPFALSNTATNNNASIKIIGWVSQLIPLSPQQAGPL